MSTYRIEVQGMHCDHCVRAVRSALQVLPGVEPKEVAIGSALVDCDGSEATLERLRRAVEEAGYAVTRTAADRG